MNLRKQQMQKAVISLVRGFLMIGLSFIILYPFLYMIVVSIREPADMLDPTVVWLPKHLTWDNFTFVAEKMNYAKSFFMSLFIALTCSIFQTFTCALAGYGFARFKFRGRIPLFFCALLTLMVPPQIINMPLYINYVKFTDLTGIPTINTILPMALPALLGTGLRAGLFIYIFRQFFKGMPKELEEAAYLDGCGPIAAFFRVMLVNAGAAILITFLISFVWYWNDYLNSALFYTSSKPLASTLATLTSTLQSARKADGSVITNTEVQVFVQTAAIMFVTPVLIFYMFLQKRFTESVVSSGIVG